MPVGIRKAGEFCWINVLTPRPAEARAFFGELLGWTYVEGPFGHAVQAGGRNIGGLFDLADPKTPPGTAPLVGVMVKVDSADAMGERVRALGGRARPAFDVLDQGRMTVCHDPNGAHFDLWEARKMPGTEVDSRTLGAPSWFETMTSDVDRAASFYGALFGWTREATPLPRPGATYTVFKRDGEAVAGMLGITPLMGAVTPHWQTYFTVSDTAGTERAALRLGGTIHMQLREVAGGGRICGITSPQGVPFRVGDRPG